MAFRISFFNTQNINECIRVEHYKHASFFSGLIKNGFIKVLKNVHTDKERLFMLTQLSVDFLEAREFDVSNAVTKAGRLERYSMVLHDIGIAAIISSIREN